MSCPICAGTAIESILRTTPLPILTNRLLPTAAAARAVARERVALCRCDDCGHVFNRDFDGSRVEYGPDYENALHFSPRFRTDTAILARDLVLRHQLNGKTIVEIGAGDGNFLTVLCEAGAGRGYGFDPSCRELRRIAPDVVLAPTGFWEAPDDYRPDLICCRHVLEHLQDPIAFLRRLESARGRSRAAIFVEVPNGESILREARVWDVIYEHAAYFTAYSLATAFQRAGLAADRLETGFDDQFLRIEAGTHETLSLSPPAPGGWLAADFRRRADALIDQWGCRISELHESGQRCVLWGAGSKGVTFLNSVDPDCRIAAAVDINPRKWGRFLPGSGHPVIPPTSLAEICPDIVIVSNPAYAGEVTATIRDLGLSAMRLLSA